MIKKLWKNIENLLFFWAERAPGEQLHKNTMKTVTPLLRTGPVKEELRQKLFKIDQFGSKIKNMRVSKFWIPEIQNFAAGGQCQPSR